VIGPVSPRWNPAALLADPTRIKILWALLQGESSVACLAEFVGAALTAVSQHLAKFRLAGLVRGRREGAFVHYSSADAHVRALLGEALFHADHTDRSSRSAPGLPSPRAAKSSTCGNRQFAQ
jgi:DNA-binding transcriptional ArsR family regulator